MVQNDGEFVLQKAFLLAQTAQYAGEVPVGAIVLKNDTIIAQGFNQKEMRQSVLYHAELIALQAASQALNAWRLQDCIMVITLEPCLMCASALQHARIQGIIYSAQNLKSGAFSQNPSLQWNFWIQHIPYLPSSQILSTFFSAQRSLNPKNI